MLTYAFRCIMIVPLLVSLGCISVTFGKERTVQLVEVGSDMSFSSPRLVNTIPWDPKRQTLCIAPSPDGRRIAFASQTTRVWSGEQVTMRVDMAPPLIFASNDVLVGVDRGVSLVALDLESYLERFRIDEGEIISAVTISDDRRRLAVAVMKSVPMSLAKGEVYIYEVDDDFRKILTRRRLAPFEEGPVYALAFSKDGNSLLAGTGNRLHEWGIQRPGRLHVIESASGRERASISAHEGWLTAIAVSRDGLVIATGATDGKVKVWNWPTFEYQATYNLGERGSIQLAWGSHNELFVATASYVAAIWARQEGPTAPFLKVVGARRSVAAFADDRIVTGLEKGGVGVWKTSSYLAPTK